MSRRARERQHGRRAWTPDIGVAKFATLMAMNAAAVSHEPLKREDLQRLLLSAWGALDAVRAGAAESAHMRALVDAVNLTIALCDAGLGDEWANVVDAGKQALLDMGTRHAPGGAHPGRFIFKGPEMIAVSELLELHEAQLRDPSFTEAHLMAAVRVIHARIESGNVDRVPSAPPVHATTSHAEA